MIDYFKNEMMGYINNYTLPPRWFSVFTTKKFKSSEMSDRKIATDLGVKRPSTSGLQAPALCASNDSSVRMAWHTNRTFVFNNTGVKP